MEKNRRWFCLGRLLCLKNGKTRVFKVILLLSVILLPGVVAAQQQKVTIHLTKVGVQDVFKEINKQTRLNFVYNAEQLKEIGSVTLNLKNVTVDSVLTRLFEKTSFTYKFEMQSIIIKKKTVSPAVEKMILTGEVTDSKGVPLPGVTIVLKGTTLGITTDAKGKFTFALKKSKNPVLVFSFIGMKKVEHAVVPGEPILIKMEDDVEEMEEVVVTGYGNINTKSFTGNARTIRGDDLLKVSRTNIIKALQIFDPSFKITEDNLAGSDPNKLPEVTIRGRSSLGKMELDELGANPFAKSSLEANPNTPTFVIDGFEVDIRKIYDLDPNRIESVTLLKDAAATAMYGSRAANGVVVITTRTPKEGGLQVSYNVTGSVEFPDLSGYNLMNAREKLEAEKRSGVFDYDPNSNSPMYDGQELYMKRWNAVYVEGVDTDWMALPLRTAFRHDHSLQVESGSKAIRYSLIVDYSQNDGVMKGSERNTWGGEFNIHLKYGKLFLRNSVSYHYTSTADSPYGAFRDYSHQLPYVKYKDANGNLLKELTTFASGGDSPNPMYEARLESFAKTTQHELMDNLQLRCNVTNYLMIQGSLGVTQKWNDDSRFIDPLSKYTSRKISVDNLVAGDLYTDVGGSSRVNVRLGISLNKTIEKHDINIAINGELTENKSHSVYTHYVGFPSGHLSSVNYASEVNGKPSKRETTSRSAGINGILNYSWNDIYLMDFSFRYEGSSVFGTEKKGSPYWACGLGINIHKYSFLENTEWLDRLRLRGSYGMIGNINFPAYAARNYFVNMFDDWYVTGFGTKITYLGNHSLKPEKTSTVDVGVDASFLRGKINLKLSYYNKTTVDMVNDVTIPSTSGFSVYKDNLGKVRNEGVEFDIYASVYQGRDFSLALNGNIARNKNRMLEIGKSLEDYNRKVEAYYDNSDKALGEQSDERKIWTKFYEGGSLTAKYGMRSLGIDPATGQEVFLDKKGAVVFENDPKEYVVIGDTEPLGSGSLGLHATYRNFTLTANFSYEFGSERYNETLVYYVENANIETENVDKRVLSQRWQNPGDKAPLKDIKERYKQTRPTSRFMQDYNMFSLSSMSLQYELGKSSSEKLGLERVRLEIGCGELFQLCSVKRERGLDYPFARSFNFNLMINF